MSSARGCRRAQSMCICNYNSIKSIPKRMQESPAAPPRIQVRNGTRCVRLSSRKASSGVRYPRHSLGRWYTSSTMRSSSCCFRFLELAPRGGQRRMSPFVWVCASLPGGIAGCCRSAVRAATPCIPHPAYSISLWAATTAEQSSGTSATLIPRQSLLQRADSSPDTRTGISTTGLKKRRSRRLRPVPAPESE